MLKKSALRKIWIATLSLVIVSIIYLFPVKEEENLTIPREIEYLEGTEENIIYLIDDYEYVARTNIIVKGNTSLEKAEYIIETLTIGSSKEEYIPNGFKPIIPEKTTINSISLKDGLLKVDFSKEFLNIDKENEEKMIESLVYSLTTIDEIKQILIYVDGEHLSKMPHGTKLNPNPLTRDFGINKVYDLNNLKGSSKTTVYYLSKNDEDYYYVPITKISNETDEKAEIIIKELKGTNLEKTNLISYLSSNLELLEYEVLEDKINLSFNEYLLNNLAEKDILEEVQHTISLSIMENYDIEEVAFFVNDELIDNVVLKNIE